ncbi:hypothetical protein TRIUR3_07135 [Triticum urartu]|uniref:Uncharacterized protein n=1 Tax=Triticum urartu TaxID=4572 RepID=M7ZIK6_TRIUA|nr:hypothetical protein TRIUR3_07135 [Triticum urartu]
MVFGMNDARRKASGRIEVEDLCSKLTSLLPQDYRLGASQFNDQNIVLDRYVAFCSLALITVEFKICTRY